MANSRVEEQFKEYIRKGYDVSVALAMCHNDENLRLAELNRPPVEIPTYTPVDVVDTGVEDTEEEIEAEETPVETPVESEVEAVEVLMKDPLILAAQGLEETKDVEIKAPTAHAGSPTEEAAK